MCVTDGLREREKNDQKFQEAQAAAEASTRGRGGSRGARGARGGRGRGGGRGGFDAMPLGASGPFALGSVVSENRQKVMAERGTGYAKSSRTFNYKARVKAEGGAEIDEVKAEYSSSDESDGPKMDVEYISLLDDNPSEDEEGGKDPWGAGAPIRIPRSEHVDRQLMVNTDSSSKKGKAELKAMKDKEMTFETDIYIKDEPEEDEEEFTLPASPELSKRKVKLSESPEMKKKKDPSDLLSSPSKPRRRRSSLHKKKPIISTTEEKEEFERLEADRVFALNELGGGEADPELEIESKEDEDGDVDMLAVCFPISTEPTPTDKESQPKPIPSTRNSETENQIFFFQFPPLLPHLIPADTPTKLEPTEDAEIKPDLSAAPITAAAAKKSALKGRALLKSQLALLTAPPAPGLVGKLRVHKSGRISMLWGTADAETGEGEIEMEVNRGAHCEFLQEVVVMKETSPYGDDDLDEKGRPRGVAYSLGQVKGKYVVSPDFVGLLKASSGKRKAKRVEIVVDE